MSKTECPICGSYSSTITAGIERNGKCPICGTSQETIFEIENIESKKKYYKSLKISEEIVNENELLKKELVIKKDKFNLLKEFTWNMYFELERMQKDLYEVYFSNMTDWEENKE